MKSAIARQVLSETPAEVHQFVRRHSELVLRIAELLEEKGWTQKDLAKKLGKNPSEISKWLSGEHNLTLRSLTKLEVELGADLIHIPRKSKFKVHSTKTIQLNLNRNDNSKNRTNTYHSFHISKGEKTVHTSVA